MIEVFRVFDLVSCMRVFSYSRLVSLGLFVLVLVFIDWDWIRDVLYFFVGFFNIRVCGLSRDFIFRKELGRDVDFLVCSVFYLLLV